jgi:leucyl aminopeptidase
VPADVELLGVPVFSDLSLPDGAGAELDLDFLRSCGFEGRPGQLQAVPADDGSVVVALGVGPRDSVDADALRSAGAALARHAGTATRAATTLVRAVGDRSLAAAVVEGIGLAAYRFNGVRRASTATGLEHVVVVGGSAAVVHRAQVEVEATCRARDWVNEPPRTMTPSRLAEISVGLAESVGIRAEIWDRPRIEAERLGGLSGVASGSAEAPRLIRLAYEPNRPTATVALVGKGITFDSGGLSLKTAAGMMTMKADMGGAAAVIAALGALAELRPRVRVVGWVAATENMPSGTAIHPGDVLVTRSGTSVEVLNTDAEGRLVLADALALAAEEEPDAIVDIATLTGGQRVALGSGVAAVMGNDEALVARVVSAGRRAGEPTWELPLVTRYRRQLDSDVADLKNVAAGPGASAIMAGLFLQEFVSGRPWAHLDIAGPSWAEGDDGWLTKGGTGWGTRTLIELVSAGIPRRRRG